MESAHILHPHAATPDLAVQGALLEVAGVAEASRGGQPVHRDHLRRKRLAEGHGFRFQERAPRLFHLYTPLPLVVRFTRSTRWNVLRVSRPRFHHGDHRQNDVRDSDHQVPHRSHLLPRGHSPRLYTASAMPAAFQALKESCNHLLFIGIKCLCPTISWRGRKTEMCVYSCLLYTSDAA